MISENCIGLHVTGTSVVEVLVFFLFVSSFYHVFFFFLMNFLSIIMPLLLLVTSLSLYPHSTTNIAFNSLCY